MGVKEASAKYLVTGGAAPAGESVPAGFKRTEIGVFPEDWSLLPLGQLLAFKNGLNKGKEYFGQGTPIVNYMDVYRRASLRATDLLGRVEVNQRELDSFGVRKGDVFFTRTSETLDEIGIASVLEEDSPRTVFSGFLLRGRAQDDRLVDAFKRYCFGSAPVRNQVTSTGTYTTRALTNSAALSRVLLPFPRSHVEQRAIAETLSDTDVLIESLQQLIAKKRALKQGAMQALLTGRQRLPGYAQPWLECALADAGVFRKGQGVTRAEANSGDLPCVRYGEIYTVHENVIRHFESRISCEVASRATQIRKGDILFAGSGETKEEIGKCAALVDDVIAYAGGDIVVFRPGEGDATFYGYLLNAGYVNDQKSARGQGDAVVHISAAALATVTIRLPRIEEQTAIATVLSDIDAEIDALEARLAKTGDLKAGMMQALLTGRMRLPLDQAA